MTFDEYAEKHLHDLNHEARRLVQLGWNAHSKFSDQAARAQQSGEGLEVPEGWKILPVHATADMVRRGKRAHGEEFLFSQDPDTNIQSIWKAMLAIAPEPPADKPEGEWVKDVVAERHRQDQKWGGPEHDDQKSPNDFVQHIEDYAGWARVMAGMGSFEKYRRRMVQVAALAGAAIEASDRAMSRAAAPDMGGEK